MYRCSEVSFDFGVLMRVGELKVNLFHHLVTGTGITKTLPKKKQNKTKKQETKNLAISLVLE